MTYSELKTTAAGFNTSHVIDDVINNARFCYGKKADKMTVSEYDLNKIKEAAIHFGEVAA